MKLPTKSARIRRALKFFKLIQFPLKKWQEEIVTDVFGTVQRNGLRRYEDVWLEVPKKNGKTTFAAALAACAFYTDTHVENREVYAAATTRDQAGRIFMKIEQIVSRTPALDRITKVVRSTKTLYLKKDPSCYLRAISSEAGGEDGAEPHVVVFAEVHRQKTRELYDVLIEGMATRDEPLFINITTAGVEGESPLCEELHDYAQKVIDGTFKDKSLYPLIWSLGKDEDWTDERNWKKVNPALGDFKKLAKVRKSFERALLIPSAENSFRRFHLNQWVSQESRWIPMTEWDACDESVDAEALFGERCYAGLDLSTNKDITAFVMMFPVDDVLHVVPHFWLPEEAKVHRQLKEQFDRWTRQGLLHRTPGNIVDYDIVRDTIRQLGEDYQIEEIGHDPWNATQISTQLQTDGFTMVPIRQGYQSMSAPTKAFETHVLARQIAHGGHPVLRWMMDCVTVIQDNNDNVRPVKPDRVATRKRIDGVVCMILGVDRYTRNLDDGTSSYETEDLFVIGGE